MPKFVLDGKEIEFEQGQTIIQAAKNHGITIPHFCWHESLSVSGNCRVCLVEIEKMPKLAIACSTIAAEGMVVYSASEKALNARNAVMEFELINHPLDCPICDEAGECKLQEYAYSHGTGESRFNEQKTHKEKRVPLGPLVMFDGDRCISCSRCIRFCDEIAKEPQLTFIKRGDRVTIVTYPGKQLDNPYSMNVTDICPVGALTSRDFRFKARVWELSSTKSICQGCSRGCNINLEVRNNQVLRLTPRQNDEVNSFWMCDHGRVDTYKFINAEDRVDSPYLRRQGELIRIGWDEAFAAASSELKSYSKNEIAFIGSAFTTCEDNYVLAKFASAIVGTKHIDFMPHLNPAFADNILRKENVTPNSFGAKSVGITPTKGGLDIDGIIKGINDGQIKALYLMEDDLLSFNPELEDVFSKLDLFIMHSSNFNKTSALADIIFPSSTYAEKHGTVVNFEGRVQRLRPAVATFDQDRALEGMPLSRWDKFGTKFDSWAERNKRDARSSWRILAGLSGAMGHKFKYITTEEVFSDISKSISVFAGMNYSLIGDLGAKLKLESFSKQEIS